LLLPHLLPQTSKAKANSIYLGIGLFLKIGYFKIPYFGLPGKVSISIWK